MAYKGFVGSGTVGHFTTTTVLELQFPAQSHAGRMATVEVVVGTATHYFSDGLSWKQQALLATDPLTGNATGIIDPKDGSVISFGGGNPLGTTPIICAWMGNSIVANGPTMLKSLEKLSGGRLVGKYNFGAAGISTLGMLSPSGTYGGQVYIDATLALCPDASVVFLSEGSNDATSFDVPQVYTQVVALINKAKAAGKTVVLCASPPRWSGTNANVLPRTIDFNWAHYKAARDTGVLFIDPWYDWRGTDGDWKAGYYSTADGVNSHTHAGFEDLYVMAAKQIWASLAPGHGLPPTMEVLSDSRSAGLSKVIAGRVDGLTDGNALMLAGASTQWAGVVSAGTAVVTVTSESAAPFRGNQLKIDFSGGITGGVYSFSRTFSVSASTNKPANSIVIAKAVIGLSSLVNATVKVYTSSTGLYAPTDIMASLRLDAAREMYSSPEIPTGTTGITKMTVEIQPIGGVGTATGIVTISNADIYDLGSFD